MLDNSLARVRDLLKCCIKQFTHQYFIAEIVHDFCNIDV